MQTAARPAAGSYHLLIPVGLAVVIVAMILPIPKFVLDLLISLDITLSMVLLMVSMYVIRPVQFSVFPSILLLMTLFRLSLNIASTRLILLNGQEGADAAGQVIKAFGQFVVGGNFVVGAVIFLVILAVQFIVINHGATRISEVTARFTLDAMPGKQMSIDADLNAGLITEREARERRKAVGEEAEFYGSMDGAVRFTQRDAIAALLIFGINLVAGFAIGVLQHGMEPLEAGRTFSVLTIGDGLVTAIPALLVSVAGAVITTRASATDNLGTEVFAQVFTNPRPLAISGAILAALAFMPGLPTIAFLTLAGGTAALAYAARQRENEVHKEPTAALEAAAPPAEEFLEPLLAVDALGLEVGLELVSVVKPGIPGGVLDRIRAIRRQMASELGFIVPPVRVRDNLSLEPSQYSILIRGAQVASGKVPARCVLALAPRGPHADIGGLPTVDPAFGLPAAWIPVGDRDRVWAAGYTIVEPESVVSTHLMEVIRRHAAELLGREEVQKLLDIASRTHPKLISELVPEKITLGRLQRALQGLLRERVSIRDLPAILEAVGDRADGNASTASLVEAARQALARSITSSLLSSAGELEVITVEPGFERALEGLLPSAQGSPIDPEAPRRILTGVSAALSSIRPMPSPPVILCSPQARPLLRDLLEGLLPNMVVLSHHEVPASVRVRAVGTVT